MPATCSHEAATAEARDWVHAHYPWMDHAGEVLHRANRWRQYGPAIQRLVAEIRVVYDDLMTSECDNLVPMIRDGDAIEDPSGKADAMAEWQKIRPGQTPRQVADMIAARWAHFIEHGRFPR